MAINLPLPIDKGRIDKCAVMRSKGIQSNPDKDCKCRELFRRLL
jgi:hypothetical protein